MSVHVIRARRCARSQTTLLHRPIKSPLRPVAGARIEAYACPDGRNNNRHRVCLYPAALGSIVASGRSLRGGAARYGLVTKARYQRLNAMRGQARRGAQQQPARFTRPLVACGRARCGLGRDAAQSVTQSCNEGSLSQAARGVGAGARQRAVVARTERIAAFDGARSVLSLRWRRS